MQYKVYYSIQLNTVKYAPMHIIKHSARRKPGRTGDVEFTLRGARLLIILNGRCKTFQV